MFRSSSLIISLLIVLESSRGDVSHFFAPEISYFQHHHHIPSHHQGISLAFQHPLSGLYGAPPLPAAQPAALYSNPVDPSLAVTPAPVAPVASSTTEFSLPSILDNRNVKDDRQFIPLTKQYLPPLEERPNYETPEQG